MKYYKSEQVAKIGDLIATCRYGHCRIISFVDGGTAEAKNILTDEIFHVFVDECDYIYE